MLEVSGLQLRKGDFELRKLTFVVEDQSYFVILGQTGSGKTLLLESIAGLQPSSGKIVFDGTEISGLMPEKREFGLVYQDFALFPHLDVRENILFGGRFKKIQNARSIFDDLVDFLGLEHLLGRDISHLSGGEKQRVAIARAIYAQPRLLLLDEPLSAVDPTFRTSIMKSLKQIVGRYGISILHVTHNFREATYLADTISVMLDGKMLQIGKAEDVLTRPNSLEVARFLGFKNILPSSMLGMQEKKKFISINPNNILFSRKKQEKEYCLECTIKKILPQADYYKVIANVEELQIYVKVPRQMFKKLSLIEEEKLYACIENKDVVLI